MFVEDGKIGIQQIGPVRPPIDSQVDEHNLVKVEVFVGCNYIQLRECYIGVYKPTNTTVGPHLVQIGIGKFW